MLYCHSSSSFTSVQSNGERHTKNVNTYIKGDKGILVIGETDENGELKYKMRHLTAGEVKNIKAGKFIRNLCESGNCRELSRSEVRNQNIDALLADRKKTAKKGTKKGAKKGAKKTAKKER